MRVKPLAVLAGLAIVLGGVIAPLAPRADAAESFDPGNIIADSLFYDASAMSAAQIQTFLERKSGTCTNGNCLDVLRASVTSRPARSSGVTGNVICKAFTGGSDLRISEIIYRAQVACGISAKVLLVTLQKEQGLVTSTAPSDWNLNYAMGQACPDTAPCDPAFKGIGVQIISGATQLKTYKAARFARQVGTYNIQYSPTSSCGTLTVAIRNYATAALYNYTPYTPNAAALANLTGTGDKCSSYGNRNFWRDYTQWFGSTQKGSISTIDSAAHVLALDGSGELWAYPSNGKGVWMPRVSLGAPWTNSQSLLTPGDLDGDGHRDLITVDAAGGAYLHRGDGILGYLDPVKLPVDWSGVKLMAGVGDFSGDGIPDVLTVDAAGTMLMWKGTGGPAFRAPVEVSKGWGVVNLIVGVGDFDRDGKTDLLARRSTGTLVLYRGNGKGGWVGSTVLGTGWGSLTSIVAPGDFNGDGKQDILARTNTGALRLYAGIGDGRVRAGVQVGGGWGVFSQLVSAGSPAGVRRAAAAGAGDLDNDGQRDIVSTVDAGQLRLSRGNGAGGILATTAITPAIPSGARVFPLGDFDGDGVADLGMIDATGSFWLLSANGAGGYRAPAKIGTGWGALYFVFGGIDFDGDGRMDVLARDSTGALRLYRGDGAGGWIGGAVQIGSGWGTMTSIFTPGDFDGDGHPDVLARRADGGMMLYPTDGEGHWKTARQVGSGWGGFTALFSPGNFDNSGGADVVARRADGALILYKTSGKGTWAGTSIIGTGWNTATWIG